MPTRQTNPATDLLERVKPLVDETINSLAKTKFRIDPIGGERYSKATSIVSAAYKRHGQILERAVRERLQDSEYLTVWHEPQFKISYAADAVVSSRNADIENALPVQMPYGEASRTLQVDAIVYDRRASTLRAYEVKRGNGHFDAGKKRSILRDTLCTQALLRSYGEQLGFTPSVAEARVIAYYGVKPLQAPLCISGDELDDHFVFVVRREVERVNSYFKEQLYAILQAIEAEPELNFENLCDECPVRSLNTGFGQVN